jgi:hypothetical protein
VVQENKEIQDLLVEVVEDLLGQQDQLEGHKEIPDHKVILERVFGIHLVVVYPIQMMFI